MSVADLREKWNAVETSLQQNWYKPDIDAVKIQLACVAAHSLTELNPAWCLSIAPPGSAKTVILDALKGTERYHMIDQITATSFISGKTEEKNFFESRADRDRREAKKAGARAIAKRDKHKRDTQSASLLQRLGNDAMLAIADFSTILTMHETARNGVFAQMRRIYDGSFNREFGTAENIDERLWEGRITVLAACTPEIDRYNQMFSALGDRFIRVRWARASGVEASIAASLQTKQTHENLRLKVHDLITSYTAGEITTPIIPNAMRRRIGELSEFVCHARSYVHRRGNEIDDGIVVESNTRLPQQLYQVARGWSALIGENEVSEESFKLVWRVAWDCIPPARRHVLENARGAIRAGYNEFNSNNAVTRAVEELEAVSLISRKGPDFMNPNSSTSLTETAKGMLERAENESPILKTQVAENKQSNPHQ